MGHNNAMIFNGTFTVIWFIPFKAFNDTPQNSRDTNLWWWERDSLTIQWKEKIQSSNKVGVTDPLLQILGKTSSSYGRLKDFIMKTRQSLRNPNENTNTKELDQEWLYDLSKDVKRGGGTWNHSQRQKERWKQLHPQ